MPLRDPEKVGQQWTWEQAVAWIGFDIKNAPRDWDIRKQKTGGADVDQVVLNAEAAIAELIDKVASENLTPIWKPPPSMRIGESPELFFTRWRDDTQKTLIGRLSGTLDLGGCSFAGLYFERKEVLRLWPGSDDVASKGGPGETHRTAKRKIKHRLDSFLEDLGTDWFAERGVTKIREELEADLLIKEHLTSKNLLPKESTIHTVINDWAKEKGVTLTRRKVGRR